MRAIELLVVVLAACGQACNPNSWDAPAPPSAEYPCGPFGVVCTTQHACCTEGETCGGEPDSVGCPAGQCCEVGSSVLAMAGAFDGGGPPSRPQRPMTPRTSP